MLLTSSDTPARERARLEGSLAFWERMLGQLDSDARILNRVVYGSPILLGFAFVLTRSVAIGLGLSALVVSIWGMGRYMVSVRRVEYRYHIGDIHEQLRNLERSSV